MVRMSPVAGSRLGWIAVGLLLGTVSAAAIMHAQAAPAQQAAAAPTTRTFAGDGGMVLNFIKPDKTGDFEAIMTKLKEALAKSEKPERKAQAAGWKVFKASEPGPAGAAIYVFFMDPVAKGAEYKVGDILVEGFGAEGQALYKTYSEAYGTPAIGALLHLTNVIALGK